MVSPCLKAQYFFAQNQKPRNFSGISLGFVSIAQVGIYACDCFIHLKKIVCEKASRAVTRRAPPKVLQLCNSLFDSESTVAAVGTRRAALDIFPHFTFSQTQVLAPPQHTCPQRQPSSWFCIRTFILRESARVYLARRQSRRSSHVMTSCD